MSTFSKFFTCRKILVILVITGFMIHHMLRITMSIAIVDMLYNKNSSHNDSIFKTHFDWNEDQKNNILGLFYWSYAITNIPGGRCSEIFGTRKVLGISMFLATLFTFLTPIACHLGYYWILMERIILGMVLGVQWPSLPPMAVRWVSVNDSSKFFSHLIASSLGVAVTLLFCGYLISYFGWPSVFYVTGSISLIWTVAWFYFVYDSPGEHPRISEKEKVKLEKEITYNGIKREKNVPWLKILNSKPVWAISIADIANGFCIFVIYNHLPSYLKQILNIDIGQNGLLSSLPFFIRYFVSLAACWWADNLRKTAKFSITTIRKSFTSAGLLLSGLFFFILSIWGDGKIIGISLFIAALAMAGLNTPGYIACIGDISPFYSGTVFGIINTLGCTSGYFTTKIIAIFTKEKQDFQQWQYIFWIVAGLNTFAALFYIYFGSAAIQSWNPKIEIIPEEEITLQTDEKC